MDPFEALLEGQAQLYGKTVEELRADPIGRFQGNKDYFLALLNDPFAVFCKIKDPEGYKANIEKLFEETPERQTHTIGFSCQFSQVEDAVKDVIRSKEALKDASPLEDVISEEHDEDFVDRIARHSPRCYATWDWTPEHIKETSRTEVNFWLDMIAHEFGVSRQQIEDLCKSK